MFDLKFSLALEKKDRYILKLNFGLTSNQELAWLVKNKTKKV